VAAAEALREVADALDVTPAYCEAVASFYDMFHLSRSGGTWSRSARTLLRARRRAAGARGVRAELGVAPGETTEDGEVTLRTIECAGGCGWAPVVVVDHRYREPVRPRTCRRSSRSCAWS
jgi:NADH:ubiquinone oxidoreductase subunit E